MSLLDKFIDSLSVNILRAGFRQGLQPFSMGNNYQKSNVIIHLQSGEMFVGRDAVRIEAGSFYFLPVGQPIYIKHGIAPYQDLGEEGFYSDEEVTKYLRFVPPYEDRSQLKQVYSLLAFDLNLFNAVPFFEALEMPAFIMPPDPKFAFVLEQLALEFHQNNLGRERAIKGYLEQVVIYLSRHLDSEPNFEKFIERLDFLSDRRLVNIVEYIQSNLANDLSNKTLAGIAHVSEDYVGQFFKSLTKTNLQDYVENQRLDKALFYLRTEQLNVQEIAHKVGFKDPAYFSRRFKMKFGVKANSIRNHSGSLI